MIQATPFDLTLLTAATNEPIQDREIHYEQVLILFTTLRDWFLNTNRRLEENPSLTDLGLRIPLLECSIAGGTSKTELETLVGRSLRAIGTIAGQSHQCGTRWTDCGSYF